MRRDSFKLLIFAGIVGFAILYGMELSSKGIQNVNGPWETANPNVEEQTSSEEGDWTLPARDPTLGKRSLDKEPSSQAQNNVDDTLYYNENEGELGIPRNDREPIVDRVSGKTAEVLHDLSRNGIRMVVSIFDRVMG